jgi:hypothetical protein
MLTRAGTAGVGDGKGVGLFAPIVGTAIGLALGDTSGVEFGVGVPSEAEPAP